MRWSIIIALAVPLWCAATGPSDPPRTPHPFQGLADMLMEYLEMAYPGHSMNGTVVYISLEQQRMFLVESGLMTNSYPVATASEGPGSEQNSNRTPTGLHKISEKFGDDVPELGILRERRFTGELADPDFAGVDKDWITSRILWLNGLEPGVNKGGARDSHQRYIYIHGTANEKSIGVPSSRGCVRMLNSDVIDLYERVPVGALVVILDN